MPGRRSTIRYWPVPSVDRGADLLDQRRAGRFDGHAGQHGAGRVPDDAGNRSLCIRCRRHQEKRRQHTCNRRLTHVSDLRGCPPGHSSKPSSPREAVNDFTLDASSAGMVVYRLTGATVKLTINTLVIEQYTPSANDADRQPGRVARSRRADPAPKGRTNNCRDRCALQWFCNGLDAAEPTQNTNGRGTNFTWRRGEQRCR